MNKSHQPHPYSVIELMQLRAQLMKRLTSEIKFRVEPSKDDRCYRIVASVGRFSAGIDFLKEGTDFNYPSAADAKTRARQYLMEKIFADNMCSFVDVRLAEEAEVRNEQLG